MPKFANCRLCDIHTPDVQIFMNTKAEKYAPSVLYHIRATLSRTFATAKEWDYIDSNPVLGVRLPTFIATNYAIARLEQQMFPSLGPAPS